MKKREEKTIAFRSNCPVVRSLDILGDKWSLVVVRDLLLGKKTYGELQKGPEAIPTNILADRLKRLETAQIISKKQYQERPVRYSYHLTAKGLDLAPVLMEMLRWGMKHDPAAEIPEEVQSILEQRNIAL